MKKTLKIALTMEEESIKLYTSAQNNTLRPDSLEFLKDLVKEEEKHKKLILDIMRDPENVRRVGLSKTEIQDLKIVDYLGSVSLSRDADYQQILVYAAKREKATHDFYVELSRKSKSTQMGKLFMKLAQEELKHKYKLEKEYDEVILKHM